MILGFGDAHMQETRELARRIADAIRANEGDAIKAAVEKIASDMGTFKDKGWRICTIRNVHVFSRYEGHKGCMVEAVHSHIRDDHPLSPDGYAMLDVPFCVSFMSDSIWGERVYVLDGLQ